MGDMTAGKTLFAAMGRAAFVARFGGIFEHSPWVAERAWRPEGFDDADAMVSAMAGVVAQATDAEQLALLRAHPELAGREAQAGALTDSSVAEQASAGLDRLSAAELDAFRSLNTAYRSKHGFPFIVCVRHYTKAGILAELARRGARDTKAERDEALAQIRFIALLRLERLG